MLEKVERVNADVMVADRLKKWIIDSNLQPGDRMPTEQQLSEELGVARHTLREGVKRLSQFGIVESKTGSGMFISDISFDNMSEYMMFLMQRGDIMHQDILNIRSVLEEYSAGLAAEKADAAHVEKLRAVLEDMREARGGKDWERYVQCDIALHLCIAETTGNVLLIGIVSAIRQLIQSFMISLDPKTVDRSCREHVHLVDAIARHDPEAARSIMREHLSGLRGSYFV